MTAAKHTPGPWVYDGQGRVDAVAFRTQTTITDEDGTVRPYMLGLVALPYPCGEGCNHEANAHLIAAAPDLYLSAVLAEAYLLILDEKRAALWDSRTEAKIEELNKAGRRKYAGAAPLAPKGPVSIPGVRA